MKRVEGKWRGRLLPSAHGEYLQQSSDVTASKVCTYGVALLAADMHFKRVQSSGGSATVGSNRWRAVGLQSEEIMTDQIDFLKAALRKKQSELARGIRSHSAELSVGEGEHDVLDQMQNMIRRDESVAFLDVLTRTLADVDASLLAMNEGSYGMCADCGEPIATKRLLAIPWASHCIRCQEAIDHGNHGYAAVPRWDEAA
ncbi:MAG: TraR/DksA family transcriptional regulator [Bryobacterales bacterium]|nr:TraR/DksA family transcriptional regulator [Bryobacterales bacterium]